MLNALLARMGGMMPRPVARPIATSAPMGAAPVMQAPPVMPQPIARPVSTMQPMMPQPQQPMNSLINYGRPPITGQPGMSGPMQPGAMPGQPMPGQPMQRPMPAPQMAMPDGDLAGQLNALRARMNY